jgi:hypothetical protein
VTSHAKNPDQLEPLTLELLGSTVQVHCTDRAQRETLAALWSRSASSATAQDDVDVQISADDSPRTAVSRITTAAIMTVADRFVLLRGSAVADDQGRVIGLIGGASAGKSFASATLSGRGFRFVSDIVVAIDQDGAVSPLPVPVHLRDPDGGGDSQVVSLDDLGLRPYEGERLPCSRLLLLDRRTGGTTPAIEPIDELGAVAALADLLERPLARSRPLQRLAELVTGIGGVHRLRYEEIADTTDLLAELLAGSHDSPVEHVLGAGSHLPEPDALAWGLWDGRVRQAPYLDAIQSGGDMLVQTDGRPVRLTALGVSVWRAAAQTPTFDELVSLVTDELGDHPEARGLVHAALTAMCQQRVLGFARPQHLTEVMRPFGSRVEAREP